jgi:hypothetical protein
LLKIAPADDFEECAHTATRNRANADLMMRDLATFFPTDDRHLQRTIRRTVMASPDRKA